MPRCNYEFSQKHYNIPNDNNYDTNERNKLHASSSESSTSQTEHSWFEILLSTHASTENMKAFLYYIHTILTNPYISIDYKYPAIPESKFIIEQIFKQFRNEKLTNPAAKLNVKPIILIASEFIDIINELYTNISQTNNEKQKSDNKTLIKEISDQILYTIAINLGNNNQELQQKILSQMKTLSDSSDSDIKKVGTDFFEKISQQSTNEEIKNLAQNM